MESAFFRLYLHLLSYLPLARSVKLWIGRIFDLGSPSVNIIGFIMCEGAKVKVLAGDQIYMHKAIDLREGRKIEERERVE